MTLFIRVAVPVPHLGLLTYRVPDGLPRPVVGARVVVPLGSRVVTGIVVGNETASELAEGAVKPIRDVLDDEAFVPGDVIALATWTAEYYAAGAGRGDDRRPAAEGARCTRGRAQDPARRGHHRSRPGSAGGSNSRDARLR